MNEMYASLFFSSQLGNDSLCNSSCRRSACLSKASLTVTCFSKLHMWWEIAVSILLRIFQARFLDTVVIFMIQSYSTLCLPSHYGISYDDRIFFFFKFFKIGFLCVVLAVLEL